MRCPEPLAQRVAGGERGRLGDEQGWFGQPQPCLDAVLQHHHPQLFEPFDLGLERGGQWQVFQHRSAPSGEGLGQSLGGGCVALLGQRLSALASQLLEDRRVQFLRPDPKQVAAGFPTQARRLGWLVGAQQPA
jgi:hypothetical protein